MRSHKRLNWKAYDYHVQVGAGNSWLYRPLMHIDISNRGTPDKVKILAMVDSGTDSTVLDADIARSLRIDLSRCQRVRLGGIGSLDGYLSNVQLLVPDIKIAIDMPVMFAENLPIQGLLGQKHFFQRFKIRFEKDKNKFYLAAV